MTFLRVYLIGYFVVLFGAVWALWESGILVRIPGGWLAIAALVAGGLGILLAVSSTPPSITRT